MQGIICINILSKRTKMQMKYYDTHPNEPEDCAAPN